MTTEQVKAQLVAEHHLITAEKAKIRFNTTLVNGQPIGDQVFLTIYVDPNVSTHILDPVATEITNRKEELHGVEAWVDVNNLEKLAALNGVREMKLVDIAEHSGESTTAGITDQIIQNETATGLPLPVASHPTPTSNSVVFGSLICTGLVAIFITNKKRGN